MRQSIRPAIVAALVAALVGAGGAHAVNTVGSADIRNGSIRLVDLHPTTIKALKGQRGPRGLRGPQGPAGPQGPPGVPGANGLNGSFDPSKVSVVTGPAVVVPAGEVGSAAATCPAGQTAIGGGFFSSITRIGASTRGGDPSTWFIVVTNDTPIPADVWVYAVCAAP